MNRKIIYLIILLLFGVQNVWSQTVQIEDAVRSPGEIYVQVDMLNFTGADGDVAAVTLYIEYDSDLLSFVDIENTQLSGSWEANYLANEDELRITYFAPGGSGYDINGKLLDIEFEYAGGFSTDVSFITADCEIINSTFAPIVASYVDGSVSQSAAMGTVSMDSLDVLIGTSFSMPVTMEGAGFDSVNAVTLKVAYDDSQLSYTGIEELALTGVTANGGNGMIEIVWNGAAMDFTSLDTIININFVYLGGNADVDFAPGSTISSGTSTVATDYVDGYVEPSASNATLTIESVGADSGTVGVPIEAFNISQTLGSISLNIMYDNSKLTFANYTANQLSGWVVNGHSDGTIDIDWSGGPDTITDGDLITLNFQYYGGLADIEFAPGNEVKTEYSVLIPLGYVDGLVSDLQVTGNVKYANDSIIPNTEVYLKAQADSAIVKTVNADNAGDFEFTGVVPGDYFIDASTTTAWGGITLADYAIVRAFVTTGTPVLSGIYWTAADVNITGTVTLADYALIRNRVTTGSTAGWADPNGYVFENPAISVVNSNVVQNIIGLCYGDVNASYAVPNP
ncbi:MAG: hypothetical protein K9G58_15170 [Bacteroidales bacterium]|nr:hypothetical protein [Bacteroidales bacterium]